MTKPKVFPTTLEKFTQFCKEQQQQKETTTKAVDDAINTYADMHLLKVFDKVATIPQVEWGKMLQGEQVEIIFRCDGLNLTRETMEGFLSRKLPYLTLRDFDSTIKVTECDHDTTQYTIYKCSFLLQEKYPNSKQLDDLKEFYE